jgi:DNA-binding transcriptional LysR family regulator
MELRHLRTFRVVARTLNFTRAAAELHYAQSSVTEQVQSLETELGTRLFDRGGRRLRLTPAGERLTAYADQMLILVEEARTAVREQHDEPAGELIIGALETLSAQCLPPILAGYRERWPRVQVTVRDGNRGELYGAVRRGEIDACLTFGPPPPDDALDSESLGTDRLLIVTPAGHRLADREQLGPADLAGEEFLVTSPGCGFREMFDRSVRPAGPVVVAELGSLAALCGCVAAGMGIALLPEIAVRRHLDRDRVATVPLAGPTAEVAVTMTWLRRLAAKPALAAFRALGSQAEKAAPGVWV